MESLLRHAARLLSPEAKETLRQTAVYPLYHVARFVMSRLETCSVNVNGVPLKVMVPARDTEIVRLFSDGYEPGTSALFFEHVGPGDTVWDVGSQYGYFSLLSAHLNGHPERVHAFETVPYCCQALMTSSCRFLPRQVRVNNRWVGDHEGGRVITLDGYMDRTGSRPDLIKMDIEGAEAVAFKGMERVLKVCRPTIILEVHPVKIIRDFGANQRDILATLTRHGYRLLINVDHRVDHTTFVPLEPGLLDDERMSYEVLCLGQ